MWLALGACTGDDDDDAGGAADEGGAAGSATVAREGGGRAVDELVDAFCDLFDRCCHASWLQLGGRAACEAIFDEPDLFVALRAGTAVVVEPAFGTCVAAQRQRAESCDLAAEGIASCATAFMGTRAEGEPCENALACVRDERLTLCVKTGDPAAPEPELGVCHAVVRAGRGEPCQFSSQPHLYATVVRPDTSGPLLGYCDRSDGLRCDASRTCVPLRAAGEACSGHFECGDGLYCDRTCQPLLPAGEPCSETAQCVTGLLCIAGRCAQYAPEGAMSCAAMSAVPPVL